MKTYVIFLSLCAAALIIVASFVSVVGYQTTHAENQQLSSPLFAVRTQRATQQTTRGGVATFLGKGIGVTIFPAPSSPQEELIQTALRFFSTHPVVFTKLVENLDHYPYITGLLAKQGIKTEEIKTYVWMLQQHPSLVPEALAEMHQLALEKNGTQPMGLSTSNPLGCFIVAMMALVPITVTLTLLLLLFTLRIFTCMNINDCANEIANQIWSQLIQGLTQE